MWLALLLTLTLMADPVWGMLAKAQDDNQTVDEAIAAAIATHEADSEAHTGVGESLETHKSQTVIDHPAGSVVGDKFPNERMINSQFDSLDAFEQSGTCYLTFSSLQVRSGNVNGNYSYVRGADALWPPIDWALSWLWQTTAKIYETTSLTAYIGIGSLPDSGGSSFAGFKITNNTLYAATINDIDTTPVEVTDQISGINPSVWHVYRVIYNQPDGQIEFYVDGVLKKTFTSSLPDQNDYSGAIFYIKTNTNASRNIYVSNLFYSSNPI